MIAYTIIEFNDDEKSGEINDYVIESFLMHNNEKTNYYSGGGNGELKNSHQIADIFNEVKPFFCFEIIIKHLGNVN